MRKRYIVFVSKGKEGKLQRFSFPASMVYIAASSALLAVLAILGLAGSYGRMLKKVARFNQLRSEKEALKRRFRALEKMENERDQQAQSLSSLAQEVSELYGLRSEPLTDIVRRQNKDLYEVSLDRLVLLKNTAMTGRLWDSGLPLRGRSSPADWLSVATTPSLWPVEGVVTGSFGERIDPFNGEGAFHTGIDISTRYGEPVRAPADGYVDYAGITAGYGRLIVIEHTPRLSTRYGHLSGFAVVEGQSIRRGDIIGFVGLSGRSTGPHLHYEVRIDDTPVNPHRYLRSSPRSLPMVSNGD